ncbi:MAG TPA: AAA family ATPase [Thermoanaerobaculia bacterium]|nr:AAA family ATPase [Thermoanaerobaculia bacterium]
MARIVVLNGTSSSGKTAVARAFQDLAPGVFLNFSIDSILYSLPPRVLTRLENGEERADPRLVDAFYACVRELARLGHDLVIDHAITSEREAALLREAVAGHATLFVGLDCPVDVLNERESARGDRRIGMAAAQSERVHRWLVYDLRIDTSVTSAGEAARRMASALQVRHHRHGA